MEPALQETRGTSRLKARLGNGRGYVEEIVFREVASSLWRLPSSTVARALSTAKLPR
jgi:hypothetical protein